MAWARRPVAFLAVRRGNHDIIPIMKHLITLETDETGMIIAECPSIPGCISQGATEHEALENIREAIAGCLASRKANGMALTIEVREVEVAV